MRLIFDQMKTFIKPTRKAIWAGNLTFVVFSQVESLISFYCYITLFHSGNSYTETERLTQQ